MQCFGREVECNVVTWKTENRMELGKQRTGWEYRLKEGRERERERERERRITYILHGAESFLRS